MADPAPPDPPSPEDAADAAQAAPGKAAAEAKLAIKKAPFYAKAAAEMASMPLMVQVPAACIMKYILDLIGVDPLTFDSQCYLCRPSPPGSPPLPPYPPSPPSKPPSPPSPPPPPAAASRW